MADFSEKQIDRKQKGSRIALLSNINMNSAIRMLSGEHTVYEAEGYGNELGTLMNPASSYYAFAPEITFLVMDLMELLEHELDMQAARQKIDAWFGALENALVREQIYYISDARLVGVELGTIHDTGVRLKLELLWQEALEELVRRHSNVRILPYRRPLEQLGDENAVSLKMWYMGRILLSNQAQKLLCQEISSCVRAETRPAKKLLLLDLDNTLWGGLAGEADHEPVQLSEDHAGLAYKNLQRVILQMQRQGVLLGIVSKNNPEDAEAILEKHPHMVLRPEHFAVRRINWRPKHENILEIAEELNLGTDSFVFFDDNPVERQAVAELVPGCTVPDFPEKPEELAPKMVEIYQKYFRKAVITAEDLQKTGQYAANARRSQLQQQAGSFAEYLAQLDMRVQRVDAAAHIERLTQLVNKTNQFNLTTRRYTQAQLQAVVDSPEREVYLYRAEDRFGDNGIVAALIVDLTAGETEQIPREARIETFVMSCRVMGRRLEDALLEDVERTLGAKGVKTLRGSYLPTAKNKPVADLYPRLGYQREEAPGKMLSPGGEAQAEEYVLHLEEVPSREHWVKWIGQTE